MNPVLLHKETKNYIYPLSRKEVFVKVECLTSEACSISVVYWKRFRKATRKSKKMSSFNLNRTGNYYGASIGFEDVIRYFQYVFQVVVGDETSFFSPEGVTKRFPDKFFEYEGALPDDVFKTPERFKGNVGYHIFPDRFFDGELANDPPDKAKWGNDPTRDNFFGGDLKGIREKIPYLRDLGVGVIFLTPIFEARSNHKYDTIDYFKIDPLFGTIDDFRQLVASLHENGIKLVLDGVFNHIGFYSRQFQDVIEKGKESPFWKWFFINGDTVDCEKVNYECVGDYKWMPKLNTSNPETQDYLISVALYWLLEGIDGWRLDVGDELASSFRKKLRQAVKQAYPDALLVAETWHDGEDLLRGDEVDSLMNYRLRDAILDYLVSKKTTKGVFEKRIESLYFDYPRESHDVLYNLIDSHDTERFLTSAHDDKRVMKLAIVLQFLLPGMPVVFYGDEIGIDGSNDPLCRATMKWDAIDHDLHDFYKGIIHLKNVYDAFKIGKLLFLDVPGDAIAFIRKTDDQVLLVVINPGSKKETLTIPKINDKESDANKTFLLSVDPMDYVVKDLSNVG